MHREEMVAVLMEARKEQSRVNLQKVNERVIKILAECIKAAKKRKHSLRVDVPKSVIEGVRTQLLDLKYDVEDGAYSGKHGGRKSLWLKITWWKE